MAIINKLITKAYMDAIKPKCLSYEKIVHCNFTEILLLNKDTTSDNINQIRTP